MDPRQLQRLKEEQDRALAETDRQLEQWKKFRSDYVALKDRLSSLPKKTTHEVMVPFGSLAFMPGQLVHTNEILVLLGDNYFVERSAFQAADIVSRRLRELDRNIESLQKQRDLLVPRTQFTSDLISSADENAEQKEIVEPYDEENEAVWRERHREYLRRAGQKRRKEQAASEEEAGEETAAADQDLWERLDQLELQERRRNELQSTHEEDGDMSDLKSSRQLKTQSIEHRTQGSEFRTQSPEGKGGADVNSSAEDSETEEDEDEDEEEEQVCQTQRVIRFSHTKTPDSSESRREQNAERTSENGGVLINSPADLYHSVKASPRSILKTLRSHTSSHGNSTKRLLPGDGRGKTVTFDSGGVKVTCPSQHQDDTKVRNMKSRDQHHGAESKAFQDVVVERPVQPPSTPPAPEDLMSDASGGIAQGQIASTSKRPLSRFQLARQKKT